MENASSLDKSATLRDELYGPGASKTFLPGAELKLNLRLGETTFDAVAVVSKAFTPFTQAQVLLVDVSGVPSVTQPAVLKIYDPRFLPARDAAWGKVDRPWSLLREIEAAQRRALRTKEDASRAGDSLAVDIGSAEGDNGDDDDDSSSDDSNDDGSNVDTDADLLDYEDYWLEDCERQFRVESICYERLRSFQGTTIPVCYAVGSVHAASPDPATPRPVSPSCMLLEYIDGDTLKNVKPARVPRSISRSLLETVHAFAQLGVCHDDLNAGNYLFSPPNASGGPVLRAVIIDFGEGCYRWPEATDDEWNKIVRRNGDFKRVCGEFERAGIRLEDPVPQWSGQGAATWNAWALRHRRWVDPIKEVWVSPEGIQLVQPIRWRLKPEVERWLNDLNKVGVDPPRPGSPGYDNDRNGV